MKSALLALLVLLASLASRCTGDREIVETSLGTKAWTYGKTITDFGPRPPGSAGIESVRTWIEQEVGRLGGRLARDRFSSVTPIGQIEMQNLSFTVAGRDHTKRVLLVAHYDSKRFIGFDFVGANDAASSVGLLLAMVPEIRLRQFAFDTEIVFVDGEEALDRWTAADSLYGSRHLAATISRTPAIAAAVVVDMIGDANLTLLDETTCDPTLRTYLKEVLTELGAISLLDPHPSSVEDDHVPLIQAGIPTLHLMDFTYGGDTLPGTYWHKAEDTMDQVSPKSLSIVGEVLLRILAKISASGR